MDCRINLMWEKEEELLIECGPRTFVLAQFEGKLNNSNES